MNPEIKNLAWYNHMAAELRKVTRDIAEFNFNGPAGIKYGKGLMHEIMNSKHRILAYSAMKAENIEEFFGIMMAQPIKPRPLYMDPQFILSCDDKTFKAIWADPNITVQTGRRGITLIHERAFKLKLISKKRLIDNSYPE